MKIKRGALAGTMVIGVLAAGVGTAPSALAGPPTCKTQFGVTVPADLAKIICNNKGQVITPKHSKDTVSTKDMVLCAVGFAGGPLVGATGCLVDIGFPDFGERQDAPSNKDLLTCLSSVFTQGNPARLMPKDWTLAASTCLVDFTVPDGPTF